jgi:hypothetical protein
MFLLFYSRLDAPKTKVIVSENFHLKFLEVGIHLIYH